MPDVDPAITAFFALPPTDAGAAIEPIFAPDAHVNDEKHDHHGRPAIIDWWHETNRTTPFESSLLSVEAEGDTRVAAAEVRGNFPAARWCCVIAFGCRGDDCRPAYCAVRGEKRTRTKPRRF